MRYAKGKQSWSLCDKCGLTYKYLSIASENGTGWRVCADCNDRRYNEIGHPQNHIGDAFQKPEAIVLRYPRPDVPLAVSFEAEDVHQQMPYGLGGEDKV